MSLTTTPDPNRRRLKLTDAQAITARIIPYVGKFKAVMGTVTSTAYYEMTNAFYKVRQSPQYRHQTKKLFNDAMQEYFRWERALVYPGAGQTRFFEVAELKPEDRKRFGEDFSDQQFFEFWQGLGALPYEKAQPLIGSLRHKFRRSLERQGLSQDDADLGAYALSAATMLQLAEFIYERVAMAVAEDCKTNLRYIDAAFHAFRMNKVMLSWAKAVHTLKGGRLPLTDEEEHNIHLSIDEITDIWEQDGQLVYDAYASAIEEYSELFRTRGEQKKLLRELAERRFKD